MILLWLGREDVGDEEKEKFIQKLVELNDGVKNFYGYQAYFLAAAGINEFKACSLASEIVRQVVKWAFGCFNIEKQEWRTFLNPIEEGARKAIPETIRQMAISALIDILDHCPSEYTRRQAAESLGEIDQGSLQAITALVKLIATTKNESTRRKVLGNLGKIGVENPIAIAALVEIIETAKDESTRRKAAESLEKIDPGNPQVIAALVEIIETSPDESTRRLAAWSLGEIDPGNSQALAALVEIIETSPDENTRRLAAWSLGKIDPGNPQVIAALVEIIETSPDENTRRLAAWSLGKIDPGNPQVIAALVKIIETSPDENTRRYAAKSLGELGQENPEAVASLVKIIATTENENIRLNAAMSLGTIDVGNPIAIAALIELIATTQEEFTCRYAAESLGEIDPGNPEAIAALVQLIETTQDEYTSWLAAMSLGKIDPGNLEAIAALIELIATTESEDEITQDARWLAVENLKRILITPQQYAGVVFVLKDCLSDDVYQNNFDRFNKCYKIIWNCAANLPYPQFYQAWHHPVQMTHPEVEDNTPVASTPFTQHCNLALLPQIINQAIQSSSRPPNRQVICIDGSRFSDPSNPALQIYTALKKAGCPPITQKPGTINELQAYCEDDLSTAKIALIFYESPTDPPPQGLDLTVLNQLARFSHPPIAVIVPAPLANCQLPQFLETEPDLISNILQWLHNLER